MSPCLNLEDALKLSTSFSLSSTEGDIPADLLIPVPSTSFCEFHAKAWGAVTEAEREAFKAFYLCVGENLEDVASLIKQGGALDETNWARITEQIKS